MRGSAWRRCVALAALAMLVRAETPQFCCAMFYMTSESYIDIASGQTVRNATLSTWQVRCLNSDCDEINIWSTTKRRLPGPARLTEVWVEHCAPPWCDSFVNALAALDITAFSGLGFVLSSEDITRAQLAVLDPYHTQGAVNWSLPLGTRRASPALRELTLDATPALPDLLCHLPPTLDTFALFHTGAARVHLGASPGLRKLYLAEDFTVDVNVSAAHALQELYIHMPNIAVHDDALPRSLRRVQYTGWNDTHAAPLTRCDHLESFSIEGVMDNSSVSLPDAWVARCGNLAELSIARVPLRALPAALLARTAALKKFMCMECALTELPLGLFDDTRQLQHINLGYNQIKSVPRGLFEHVESLETLDLSYNRLTSAGAASLADVLSVRVLRLDNNPELGELCDGFTRFIQYHNDVKRRALAELSLYHTNITRVCHNLRNELGNLQLLDADPIAFDNLTYSDLQYSCPSPGCIVNLGNGGAFSLLYTREDYETVLHSSGTAPRHAFIKFGGVLRCDCSTYWAALAFSKNEQHVRTSGLKCRDTELSAVDVDTLTCDASTQCAPLRLPANCTCGARPDYQYGAVVIVTCERANLTALPRLPPANHKWRLHLAHNNISTVHAADVSRDIVELDLRNNSIRHIDSEAAVMLADIPLQLAGNHQVECGCEAFDMLVALLNISSQLQDADKVTCTDGKRLTEASRVRCASITGPTMAGLAVLLGFSLALGGLLAQPKTRQYLKTMLISMGWLPPPPEPKDDRYRRFDVFVSYAHEDEKFVVEQLADHLERGPRPYRLCMHQRDWAPGEWIPAQIAASVRSSRRTLAVVSQHYVRSAWARAEFREAHAATLQDPVPRLVVLLLDDPASLPLDPELRAYVRQNTYVRWGDPWFWEKLRQALPPPRAVRRDEDETAVAAPSAPSEPSAPSSAP